MDWRLTLTSQSRQDVILKLIEVVKLAAPTQDHAKLAELAASTEQSIFEKAKSKQEYIHLLQQKIANLQAKIAVMQKNQGAFGSPAAGNSFVNNQGFQNAVPVHGINPAIAPKYPGQMGQMGGVSPQMGQVGANVPVNLRNMVFNLQQQQAQNLQNSKKNQLEVQHALQAANIAKKTLIGVQMQSSNGSVPASSAPMQASLQLPMQSSINSPAQSQMQIKSPMVQYGSPAGQTGNSIAFPSLNLNEAQKADITEKLKKIMPIYQKIDLISNYLSASDVPAKNNIQKLLQLKNLLTEQYKNLKKRIFISADGLDNIYEFLVKMLKAAEEVRSSKISTPSQSIQTPTNIQKSEIITNAFKYAKEQELYLKKSSKSQSAAFLNPITTGNINWTSELKMYGIDSDPVLGEKSCLGSVFEDYEYLFGSFDNVKEETKIVKSEEITLDSEIDHLESLGFTITKLPDFKDLQVFLVKNTLANWTIIVHLQNSLIKEWQLLDCPVSTRHDFTVKSSLSLDRNLLEGKSLEMVQFLQFS